MTEEKFSCPRCGTLVSRDDEYCRKCGVSLKEISKPILEVTPSEVTPSYEEPYERKFSWAQRFLKLLTSPSEAMEDIASAPSYEGIVIIAIAEFVFMSAAMMIVSQKIEISGPHSPAITNMLSLVLTFAVFLGSALFAIKWAIKSYLVKVACDNRSGWDFKTAATITSYAYVADIIISVLGICVSWFLIPTFHIDTTDLDAARQSLNDYQAQIAWLNLTYQLPLSLLTLLWKSYLGGLGAHFGTGKRCSISKGLAIFFMLGLIGLLISFVL